jgi:hypothetical protein
MKDLTPLFQAAVEMKAKADRLTAEEKEGAIEGEFTPAPISA